MENAFAQQKFPRLYEIYALSDRQNENNCLYGFSERNPDSDNLLYVFYENLFQRIDQDNWEVFKEKYSPPYPRLQGFNYFNEVQGYLYLKDRMHCEELIFLQEAGKIPLKLQT